MNWNCYQFLPCLLRLQFRVNCTRWTREMREFTCFTWLVCHLLCHQLDDQRQSDPKDLEKNCKNWQQSEQWWWLHWSFHPPDDNRFIFQFTKHSFVISCNWGGASWLWWECDNWWCSITIILIFVVILSFFTRLKGVKFIMVVNWVAKRGGFLSNIVL